MFRWTGRAAAMLVVGLCGLAGARSASVAAEERPPLLPTRDVVVEYRATGNGHPSHLRVLYDADTDRLRAEAIGQSTYVIIDGRARTMQVVLDRQKSVMTMPFDADRWRGYVLSDRAHFTRLGVDKVVGIACTEWRVEGEHGGGTACVTDDGVILRGQGSGDAPAGQGSGSIEATAVRYGEQPDDVFHVPPGYTAMAIPILPHLHIAMP